MVIPSAINTGANRHVGLLDHIKECLSTVAFSTMEHIQHRTGDSSIISNISAKVFLYTNDFLGILLIVTLLGCFQRIMHSSFQEIKDEGIQMVYDFAKVHIPFVRKQIEKEETKMVLSVKKSLWRGRKSVNRFLPKEGLEATTVFRVRINGSSLQVSFVVRKSLITHIHYCAST